MEAAPHEDTAEEIKRLQRCMNDLLSLLALPAIWSGGDAGQIARVLVDSLLGMLRLDFIYVRMNEPFADTPSGLGKLAPSRQLKPALQDLQEVFRDWLDTDPRSWPSKAQNPAGEGQLSIVALRLGSHDELGMIVAGSERADFPREAERLLLSVAANQAAIALQDARHQSQQRRHAEELERRVAQRTAELAAANKELHAEVAERKRAEAAVRDNEESIRASEERLLKIINTLPATAWSTRPDGYCDFLSQRWLEYAGFSAEQAQGWGWGDVIHPDDAPGLVEHWQSSLATGEPIDAEARMRRFDGAYRWFLFRANPLRDERGNIVKWYGTNIDIEDRKLAQEELRQRERDARLIVDSIPAQVAVLGPGGEIDQVNRRMAEFFGDSVSVLGGWKTGDIVPADELPQVRANMAAAFANAQPFIMENHLRSFDGVYRWFQVQGSPLLDAAGRAVRWYFLLTDIEERKHAEEALRRSEALLAQAQRISSTGSFSWQLDTDEFVFSEELRRIFELDSNSTVTLSQLVSLVHPDDTPVQSNSLQHLKAGGDMYEEEIRLRFPDGRIKHIRTFGRVIHHPDARRECIGAVQDVTQRYLSNEALEKARSELAHVNRRLSLGAMTASIAHEVNQPLSGIVTNASTCVRLLTAAPPNIDGALETARRTIRDANRAADIIARLRALFGGKAATLETVDLNAAAREVISLLSRDLQRSRVILRTELDDDPLLVRGDRVQLQQVILNLVRNASEAMADVHDRPRQLSLTTEREQGDHIRLTVRDVGVGLALTDAERVFDAFYTTKNDSMGVGLSVSRSIVESHGGRLWAAANEGHGATFTLSIPCTFEDMTLHHSADQNSGQPLGH